MIEVIVDEQLEGHYSPPERIAEAVTSACDMAGFSGQPDLCIRFAGNEDVRELNAQWREKDCVTDVLSFPMQEGPEFDLADALGDIALAVPFIVDEAERLGVEAQSHVLHLVVHATLHLLGYDHIDDADADRMQALERQVMAALNLHDPYPQSRTEDTESL